MSKELQEELIRFVNSVANDENWYGEALNQWFAKRHARHWVLDLQQNIKPQETSCETNLET